jgi:hypothetical protein
MFYRNRRSCCSAIECNDFAIDPLGLVTSEESNNLGNVLGEAIAVQGRGVGRPYLAVDNVAQMLCFTTQNTRLALTQSDTLFFHKPSGQAAGPLHTLARLALSLSQASEASIRIWNTVSPVRLAFYSTAVRKARGWTRWAIRCPIAHHFESLVLD